MMTDAVSYLLDTLTGILTVLLLLRFYMQAFRVSFANQLGAFVLQLTTWLVLPMRRIIPAASGLDLASLLGAYLSQLLFLLVLFAMRAGGELPAFESMLVPIFWQAALNTLRISIHLLIGALILQAVLSWVNPSSPLGQPLAQLTQPFLSPLRRFIPPIANIDLSPLVAILLAQLVLKFL